MNFAVSYAVLIGRILLGIAGVSLIYSSIFLYESEEGGVENVLEHWWNRVRVLRSRAISLEAAFLKVASEITSKAFSLLFGERLFGPKAIAASVCYSVAALFAYTLARGLLYKHLGAGIDVSPVRDLYGNYVDLLLDERGGMTVVAGLCVIFVIIGSLGPMIQAQGAKLIWLACAVIMAVSLPPLCGLLFHHPNYIASWFGRGFAISLSLALPSAVVCNFLFVVFTRVALRRAATSDSFIKIIGYSIASAVVAYVLFRVPGRVVRWTQALWIRENTPFIEDRVFLLTTSFLLLRAANFLGVVVSFVWLFMVSLMLVQRVIWPIVERPIYALHRYKVFSKQKKLVFFSGVLLLGIAIPSVGNEIQNIVKSLRI
jgi:hypothetical protein